MATHARPIRRAGTRKAGGHHQRMAKTTNVALGEGDDGDEESPQTTYSGIFDKETTEDPLRTTTKNGQGLLPTEIKRAVRDVVFGVFFQDDLMGPNKPPKKVEDFLDHTESASIQASTVDLQQQGITEPFMSNSCGNFLSFVGTMAWTQTWIVSKIPFPNLFLFVEICLGVT